MHVKKTPEKMPAVHRGNLKVSVRGSGAGRIPGGPEVNEE